MIEETKQTKEKYELSKEEELEFAICQLTDALNLFKSSRKVHIESNFDVDELEDKKYYLMKPDKYEEIQYKIQKARELIHKSNK